MNVLRSRSVFTSKVELIIFSSLKEVINRDPDKQLQVIILNEEIVSKLTPTPARCHTMFKDKTTFN